MSHRRQLYQYKGDRCSYCGLAVDEMIARYGTFHRMFELNHIELATKDKNYDNLIRQRISTKQLDEVDKCILLCRRCHGIVHAQNITANMKLSFDYAGRTIEQTLNGQLIYDKLNGKATFLSAQSPMLVYPYRVYVDSCKPKIKFGSELPGFIEDHLREISMNKKLAVYTLNKKFQMRAIYTEKGLQVEHSIRFPFMQAELCDNGKTIAWIRNGIMLTKKEVITDGKLKYECLTGISDLSHHQDDARWTALTNT